MRILRDYRNLFPRCNHQVNAVLIQQASGIEQVNQAVAQMDAVTQQNAALVEQAAAAAGSMQAQAAKLLQLVQSFRLVSST